MSVSGIDGIRGWFQAQAKDKTRQNMPGMPGTNGPSPAAATSTTVTPSAAAPAGITPDSSVASDPVKEFTDYMKQTPAERMQYAWLKQHGVTKAQFDSMSGAEKQKLIEEMKHELEEKMKQQATASRTDILV
jgi:phage terminase small subunit